MSDELLPAPKSPPTVFNDHNVYVLGAGFSVDAGLPTVDRFMDRMRESPRWLRDSGFQREAEAVWQVLRFRQDSAAAAYRIQMDPENIEQLFSLAAALTDDDAVALDRHVTLAIAATLEYARAHAQERAAIFQVDQSQLNLIPKNWSRPGTIPEIQRACPIYEFYLGLMTDSWKSPEQRKVDSRNTMVSFNYDLVVEEALRRLAIPFTYGFGEGRVHRDDCSGHKSDSDLRLLKLHGSVNWSLCDDYPTADNSGPALNTEKVHLHENFRSLSKLESDPVLIPPTWQKIGAGPLADVWSEAISAIAAATRIVVLGYSMPLADQHFKYLLAAGLQKNICLRKIVFVNPALRKDHPQASEIASRIGAVFQPDLKKREVLEFAGFKLDEFLSQPANRQLIGRALPEVAPKDQIVYTANLDAR